MKKILSLCAILIMATTCACSFTTDFDLPEDTTSGLDPRDTSDDTATDEASLCAGCFIQGFCFPEGVFNPQNICQVCSLSNGSDAWSDNDGQTCSDDLFCTVDDACSAGACVGTANDCDDGVNCTGTETCDDVINECVAGTTTCVGGEVCHPFHDVCVPTCTGCLIDSLCYVDGQPNPSNRCLECDVSVTDAAWTIVSDGDSCDDGDYCTIGETCNSGMCNGGAARDCDDTIDCNGVETCDNGANQCLAGTSPCAALGKVCDTTLDQCVFGCAGCNISSSCYSDGQDNPSEDCQSCDAGSSDTTWTDKDDLTSCAGGTCLSGACCAGCNIDSTCHAEGLDNPTEDCQFCETATSNTDWTNKTDGDACSGGSCLGGTCCAGCSIDGVCYADTTEDPGNDCQECNVGLEQGDWSFKTNGATCATGTCTDGVCG